MMNASGMSSKQMLKGLRPKGNAGQAAYGMAMANAASANLGRQQQNQQFGMQQMQDASSMRQKAAQQNATNLGNRMGEQNRATQMGQQSQLAQQQVNNQYSLAGAQRNQQTRQRLFDNFMRGF